MRTKNEATRAVRHGGDWTTVKLKVLSDLAAYVKVLKHTGLRTIYLDAFAGTGYREPSATTPSAKRPELVLFPDPSVPGEPEVLEGSARLALKVTPPFHRYIFIERHGRRHSMLLRLAEEFPALKDRIKVVRGDANQEVVAFCRAMQPADRAVVFLDPFGMNLEWKTVETLASTKAADVWILFPLGIGTNRLVTKSGNISPSWRRRLNLLFGTTGWYEEFYRPEEAPALFPGGEHREKVEMRRIGEYFIERLTSIFPGVAKEPLALTNRSNSPLYLLCFAAANERGKNVALRIVNHLLKGA